MIKRQLEFNEKKICGAWLILIGLVITLSTLAGGEKLINPIIFMLGYGISFYAVYINPTIGNKLSEGPSSDFQNKMGNIGIISLFVLMFLISGPFFPAQNWRMIWTGTLLATGLHFFIFYFVHGSSMILLGAACTLLASLAMLMPEIPFLLIGTGDGLIKVLFGGYLLFLSKPTRSGMPVNS
ncbi:DUF6609 family protein [Proteiniclasticum sp.]|uniref:DUF6609 family protein n=1 Tax=Proteiniclasticum sp. TaxID=2053595 RepID=UPI0028A1ED98|nr:DUF6609 family protein [Proteiniclasticum sp.]